MKVVILCGGKGTRLREETEFRPKPMVPVGRRPILWHILKIYSHFGHRDFVLCLGHRGDIIKEYFRNYRWHASDVTLTLGRKPAVEFHEAPADEDWRITFADTGEQAQTADRVRRIQRYLGDETEFMLTYGDGVGDIDLTALLAHHRRSGKICTITAVRPPGRFGELTLSGDSQVTAFNEKPQTEGGYINGGFMVFSRRIFEHLSDTSEMLEQGPLKRLVQAGQLNAYRHDGFWQPMDTSQELTLLNQLWDSGRAPWKIW
ncbi:MAG: glucose-1-phosphate cytidylyltransferase [Opitutaceae bacterium]|nr:glucose-1-phosphate cytidylyltransferase [Opitutaceae bacterium]